LNKLKFLSYLAFALLVIAVPGCKDDDDPTNEITITIEEPMDGENIAFANCGDIHIHVEFEASIENHEVEVILHPEGDVNDRIIDFDMHDHDKVIVFEQEVDLCSYGAGTCFHLEVQACVDHDCGEVKTADVEFCIQ
jgi:hypothetical protein